MSVAVDISELEPHVKAEIWNQLTFFYEEKQIFKNSRMNDKPPKSITAISQQDKTTALLPMNWAETNLGVRNDYKPLQRKFERVRQPRDEKQINELKAVTDHLEEHSGLALTLRTGAGKTAVALFTACHYQYFTVVLVHIDDHATQWANSVRDYTTAKSEIVTAKTNGIRQDTDILICLYTRWAKVAPMIRRDVGLLIIDECDDFCNPTGIASVLAWQPLKVIGCTATFEKPGTGMHTLMHSVLGYEYVTRAFDVDFDVTKVQTGLSGLRVNSKYVHGCEWNTLKHDLLYNPIRNLMIVELALIRLSQGYKVMILCSEVFHAQLLHELFLDEGVDCTALYGNMKTYTDAMVLIGTAKKCGRGFDEESYCSNWGGRRINCIMIVDYINNPASLTQWIGRGFREKNPHIDQFIDDDPSIEKQWQTALELYKHMGAKVNVEAYDPSLFADAAAENETLLEYAELRKEYEAEREEKRRQGLGKKKGGRGKASSASSGSDYGYSSGSDYSDYDGEDDEDDYYVPMRRKITLTTPKPPPTTTPKPSSASLMDLMMTQVRHDTA